MLLKISHRSDYQFDEPVPYALQQLRLTPKSRAGQRVIEWKTSLVGGRVEVAYDDHHNNHVELISIEPGQTNIEIISSGEVETSQRDGVVGRHGGFAPLWLFLRQTPLTAPGINIRNLAKRHAPSSDIQLLHQLSADIVDMVSYQTGMTDSRTTAETATELAAGVCQDHAHIFISAARQLGVPARYVSGYLMMNDRIDQVATHAWAEAHVDGLGWVGFDISNQISPDERYVRVATGLDYADAAPISGMHFGNSQDSVVVSIQVEQ
jgi:transglutaminase-like putative cysteine protease